MEKECIVLIQKYNICDKFANLAEVSKATGLSEQSVAEKIKSRRFIKNFGYIVQQANEIWRVKLSVDFHVLNNKCIFSHKKKAANDTGLYSYDIAKSIVEGTPTRLGYFVRLVIPSVYDRKVQYLENKNAFTKDYSTTVITPEESNKRVFAIQRVYATFSDENVFAMYNNTQEAADDLLLDPSQVAKAFYDNTSVCGYYFVKIANVLKSTPVCNRQERIACVKLNDSIRVFNSMTALADSIGSKKELIKTALNFFTKINGSDFYVSRIRMPLVSSRSKRDKKMIGQFSVYGQLYNAYPSMYAATKETGIQGITKCAKQTELIDENDNTVYSNRTAGGYHWIELNDYEK